MYIYIYIYNIAYSQTKNVSDTRHKFVLVFLLFLLVGAEHYSSFM